MFKSLRVLIFEASVTGLHDWGAAQLGDAGNAAESGEQQEGKDRGATRLESEVAFVRFIEPMLRERCIGCHGQEGRDIEGGLDLGSLNSMLQGGDSDKPVLNLEDPESSPLYLAACRTSVDWSAMPPKESEAVTPDELEHLLDWIRSGAEWPSIERQAEMLETFDEDWSQLDGTVVKTSGGLTSAWTNRKYDPSDLWAYQPLSDPFADTVKDRRNPIDSIVSESRPSGLQVASRADRRTLIRRATFDLTGLPPSLDEVEAFCSDPRDDRAAFSSVVDRLLDSPHYGERMAQHWLDVVRYADSSGFANDFERGNAWRYRDYVVRSFNQDKSFERFIVEQIAGDELATLTEDPIQESEAMVASGFLRMGPWELTGMEVAKVARQRFLDDVTNSVGEVFLGHSLQCARCHDHKFDPIPTRDYYSVQSVFATTQMAERRAEFLEDENVSGFEERDYLKRKEESHSAVLRELDEVLLGNAEDWFQSGAGNSGRKRSPRDGGEGSAYSLWQTEVGKLRSAGALGGIFSQARKLMQKAGFAEEEYPPRHVGFTPQQFGSERVARKGIQRLVWELDRYEPFALSVYSGRSPKLNGVYAPIRVPVDRLTKGVVEETLILTGGDPFAGSEAVTPGVLSVLADQIDDEIPDAIEGRRLAFARWVASDKNPLTPRVIANRIWLWHFGTALAGNPNNFGATGKKPTHPKLLDWLGLTLIRNGWSIKSLHRQIMNSDLYCRSSQHPNVESLNRLDPEGVTYSVFKPRRLTAEELRDSMLALSGELNRAVGGIPCRPEINQEVALQPRQVMGAFAAAWVPNPKPQLRHRRSLYVLRLRGLLDPMMEVFNSPSPDFSCEKRDASTVTPQVFTLFNGRSTHRRALAYAKRLLDTSSSDRDAVMKCFEMTFMRHPTDEEVDDVMEHWKRMEESLEDDDLNGLLAKPPLEVVREAVEENTGERFRFVEPLYANEDYVADIPKEAINRHVQSFADVCLVFFNANEFVYLY